MVFVLLTISAFLFSRVNLVIHLKKSGSKEFFFFTVMSQKSNIILAFNKCLLSEQFLKETIFFF